MSELTSVGIDDHAAVRELIDRVAERAPRVADAMQVLAEGRERLAEFDRAELADLAQDLRRSHLAIFLSLIHEADGYMREVIHLGSVYGEWPIDPDTLQAYSHHTSQASDAFACLLHEITRPREGR